MSKEDSQKKILLNRFYWFVFLFWILVLFAGHQLLLCRTINRWAAHKALELFYFVLLIKAAIGIILKQEVRKTIWVWAVIALLSLPLFDIFIGSLCDKYIDVRIKTVPVSESIE